MKIIEKAPTEAVTSVSGAIEINQLQDSTASKECQHL